jgi:hypothetical protein
MNIVRFTQKLEPFSKIITERTNTNNSRNVQQDLDCVYLFIYLCLILDFAYYIGLGVYLSPKKPYNGTKFIISVFSFRSSQH